MREKEGMALQSNEVVIAVSVVATFVLLKILGSYMLEKMGEVLKTYLSTFGDEVTFNEEFIQNNALNITKYGIMIVGPVAVIIGFVAVITVLAQTRGLFSGKSVRPKFSRLSPIQGFKRLFSLQSFVNVIKGMLELTIIGVLAYYQIKDRLVYFGKLTDMEPIQAVYYIASSVFDIVMLIFIVLAFVAAADFVFQWWQFEKKLKMSKQEVKDEFKQMEGDPQIKSKIKQRQQEMARSRMMQQVPSADVVIRNPTHYAVALRYDQDKNRAPQVVAKGKDRIALKIVEIAEENDVYCMENPTLARALYAQVDLGREIPYELYDAVAEVLTVVYKEKNKTLHA